MQSLNKSDEQKLLDGVKQAVDLVDNAGMAPNAALKKVAEEFQYSPGFLKAACNAFNNGRQLAQWNANDSILDKLASFPLANYEDIHKEIWGKSEKVANYSYTTPKFNSYEADTKKDLLSFDLSSVEKSAEAVEREDVAQELKANQVKSAYSNFEYAKRALEEARRVRHSENAKLNDKIAEIDSYFRKFAHDRLPFAVVDKASKTYYGEAGKALMDHLYSGPISKEKRASGYKPTDPIFFKPVDRNKEPFTLIAGCIKQAELLHKATKAEDAAKTELKESENVINKLACSIMSYSVIEEDKLTPNFFGTEAEKEASLLGGLAGGAGLGLAKNLAESIKGESGEKVEKQISELDSPEHLNELRKIRAQTVLTQLMSDPESPLSENDPEEVLSAYNDIVRLSPRIAEQPAALAPLLNKRLMGNTEPFEVGEQLKLEKGLKDTQESPISGKPANTDIMKNESSIIS